MWIIRKKSQCFYLKLNSRDVRQSEIQVDYTDNGIHGVSESNGTWGSRCRTEEAGNLWDELSLSCFCENRDNCEHDGLK